MNPNCSPFSPMRAANRRPLPSRVAAAVSRRAGSLSAAGLFQWRNFAGSTLPRGAQQSGPGLTLSELHAAAKATGQFYPPDPTETMAFLGGTIACNSSGARSFKYGSTRRWVERLRVALPDGEIMDIRRGDAIDFDVPVIPQPASRKHSCGYPLRPGMDWIDLFTGSEGTLELLSKPNSVFSRLPENSSTASSFFRPMRLAWTRSITGARSPASACWNLSTIPRSE